MPLHTPWRRDSWHHPAQHECWRQFCGPGTPPTTPTWATWVITAMARVTANENKRCVSRFWIDDTVLPILYIIRSHTAQLCTVQRGHRKRADQILTSKTHPISLINIRSHDKYQNYFGMCVKITYTNRCTKRILKCLNKMCRILVYKSFTSSICWVCFGKENFSKSAKITRKGIEFSIWTNDYPKARWWDVIIYRFRISKVVWLMFLMILWIYE